MSIVTKEKYVGLLKNTILFGIGLIGSKFVQFILLPYFTNVLTKAEYGTIDLVITFVGLMVPLLTLELSDSILRFGLSDDIDKTSLVNNAGVVLGGTVLLSIGFSPCLLFYEPIYNYKWHIVALVITQAFRTNEALFVKANSKITVYSIDSILTAMVIAICDIVCISKLNMAVGGYFLAEIIGNCWSFVFLMFAGNVRKYISVRHGIDWALLKKMLKYSIPLMFNALSWWVTTFSDRMILGLYFTTEDVGIYSVATKIPAVVTTFLSIFTQAWVMSAVREYESEKDVSFFENVYAIFSALLFSFASLLILVIKPIMGIYVGKNFFDAWYYVPLLMSGSVFLGISNYYGAIYASAKANLLEIKSTLICASSNIVLNFLLIPTLNILGAVIATVCSYIIVVIVRIIDTKKIIVMQTSVRSLVVMSTLLLVQIYCVMTCRWIIYGVICSCAILAFVFLSWKRMKIKMINIS